eukprot:1892857-Ditylum_brightwellii.AAC.1
MTRADQEYSPKKAVGRTARVCSDNEKLALDGKKQENNHLAKGGAQHSTGYDSHIKLGVLSVIPNPSEWGTFGQEGMQ